MLWVSGRQSLMALLMRPRAGIGPCYVKPVIIGCNPNLPSDKVCEISLWVERGIARPLGLEANLAFRYSMRSLHRSQAQTQHCGCRHRHEALDPTLPYAVISPPSFEIVISGSFSIHRTAIK